MAAREGPAKRVGVVADLALVDERHLVAVHELDRVLDGDDVALAGLVDDVDERGERGGLARAGGAGDQHQAAGQVGQRLDDGRQAELVEVDHLVGDDAEGGADGVALHEDVDAEAHLGAHGVRRVELVGLLELLLLLDRQDRETSSRTWVGGQHGLVGHAEQLAHDPHERRLAGGEVEIGPAHLDDPVEQAVELARSALRASPRAGLGSPRRRRAASAAAMASSSLSPTSSSGPSALPSVGDGADGVGIGRRGEGHEQACFC